MQFVSVRSRLSTAVLAGFVHNPGRAPKRVSLAKIGGVTGVVISGIPSTATLNPEQTAVQLFPSAAVVSD